MGGSPQGGRPFVLEFFERWLPSCKSFPEFTGDIEDGPKGLNTAEGDASVHPAPTDVGANEDNTAKTVPQDTASSFANEGKHKSEQDGDKL